MGHITTFGGHPVSCAAALAGLEVTINEKLSEKADENGQLFVNLLKQHPLIKEIRQIGLMLGVEVVEPYSVSDLVYIFQDNGLIVDQFLFNETSFRIAPPLNITVPEIELISKIIIQSLNQLKK